MSDIHDERAARILPCRCVRGVSWDADYHVPSCPAYKRPALAAEFRADAEKMEQEYQHGWNEGAQSGHDARYPRLEADLQKAKAAYEAIKEFARQEVEKHKAEVERLEQRIRILENPRVTDDDFKKIAELQQSELASLRAELEHTQTSLGQANADLMGCRDGALVRDLRVENERLKTAYAELKLNLQREAGYHVKRCACVFEAAAEEPILWCDYHRDAVAAAKIEGLNHALSVVARFECPGDQIFDAIQSLIDEAKP